MSVTMFHVSARLFASDYSKVRVPDAARLPARLLAPSPSVSCLSAAAPARFVRALLYNYLYRGFAKPDKVSKL